MIILGIDPGLRCTGWGVVEHNSGSPVYIDCGVINPSIEESIGNRLLELHKKLLDVLTLYNPTEVALEKVFVNANGATTLKLGEARGVILMTPALKGIKIFEYSPNTIKKNITGKGHATKVEVQKMVYLILSLHSKVHKKNDATDALAIALCHYYSLKL